MAHHIDNVRQDLKIATRVLLKDRGFSLATVATLAICLAANAAIFAIVNAVLFRPLPYPEPQRLVTMFNSYPGAGAPRSANSVPDYFDRLKESEIFKELALYTWTSVTVGGQGTGDPERILGMTVTPSFFHILGAQPVRGRLFDGADTALAQPREVILGETLWQRLFPARDDVSGAELRIDGQSYSVIGILASGYGLDPEVQLWMPAAFSLADRADNRRYSDSWQMIGRLVPGATLAEAQRHIDALNARNLEQSLELKQFLLNARFHTPVSRLQDDLVREVRPTILLMWAGVILVLIIGCVNVANLASARATTRSRDTATRLALGTTRGRLLQQTITESLLLSVAGGLAGVVLARVVLAGLDLLAVNGLPRRSEIALDAQVLTYTFVLVTLVAVIVGLWPTVSLRPANLARIIGEEGRSSTASRRARAMRQLLITSQVAFALVLLMGAGLLLASFQRVLAVDLGFRPERVLTGDVNLPASRYVRPSAVRAAQVRILAEVRQLPGIAAAGLTNSIPFGKDYGASLIVAESYKLAPGESLIAPSRVSVSDGYFEAMAVQLVAGRFIDARDTETAPRVIVIDELLARKFWPNASPIGRRMFLPSQALSDVLAPPPEDEWLTVVGVVKPMRLQGIVSNLGYGGVGTYFLAYRQFPERHVTLALRTQQDPMTTIRAVRAAIARIDPDLAFYDVRPMEILVSRELLDRRTTMLLAVAFAAVALLLCAIGVYGVLAYDVRQRTREIAIRMAVGADGAAIVGMVLRQGANLAAAGIVLGFGAAFLLRRTVESQLYEVGVMDPMVMTAVGATMFIVAIVACIFPARRAVSTHPMTALADQ